MSDTPEESSGHPARSDLLAIDLGLRLGLALFGPDGRLKHYRSHNLGAVSRLRRAVPRILDQHATVGWLVAEGDRTLFEIWQREALKRGIEARRISAETWRRVVLLRREQRRGAEAKASADRLARRVIEWSAAKRPTALRHDAAEAILIGLWAVLERGWLGQLPVCLRQR